MKITIISVGKIKEKFYREAIAEYAKRLSSYCKFESIELQDEKTPDKASAETERLIKEKKMSFTNETVKRHHIYITMLQTYAQI